MESKNQTDTADEYAKQNEYPLTPEEQAATETQAVLRQKPLRRAVKRAGITKNKGNGTTKQKRKQAKATRKINRRH